MRSREEIVQSARRLARERDYSGAIRQYEELLAADPGDMEARLKIGYLHACNRDREAAASTYLDVAQAYERGGDRETAVKALIQVLRLQPERYEAYFKLADLYAELGQPAEARRWLEAVEELLLVGGRPQEALRAVEAMRALDPGNVALLVRLGEAYVREGRPESALPVLYQAAEILRMAEWAEEFIKVAERISYLAPGDVALGKELATLHLRRRDPRAALRKLQRCYKAGPEDPETLGLIVECFMDLRELHKAVTILEVLMDVHQGRGEAALGEAARQRILSIAPAWVPRSQGSEGPDTQVSSPPLELPGDTEDSPVPLTTDERQLGALERSLQSEAGERAGTRRFLPAVTAPHGSSNQEARRFPAPGALEAGHPGSGARAGDGPQDLRSVSTTELDLGDLQEVASTSGRHHETQRDLVPRAGWEQVYPARTLSDDSGSPRGSGNQGPRDQGSRDQG